MQEFFFSYLVFTCSELIYAVLMYLLTNAYCVEKSYLVTW